METCEYCIVYCFSLAISFYIKNWLHNVLTMRLRHHSGEGYPHVFKNRRRLGISLQFNLPPIFPSDSSQPLHEFPTLRNPKADFQNGVKHNSSKNMTVLSFARSPPRYLRPQFGSSACHCYVLLTAC